MILILFSFSFSLFSVNQKLTLAHQQMTADYEKMRQEEADISAKLQERMSVDKSETESVVSIAKGGRSGRWSKLGKDKGGSLGCDTSEQEQCWGVICDKGIVTECDKQRLFGAIMNAKRRKEMLNLSERHLKRIERDNNNRGDDQKSEKENRNLSRQRNAQEVAKKRNFKGLVRDVLDQLPFALPTLQLHIILSLTMVLLTHQCPVASYFIAV